MRRTGSVGVRASGARRKVAFLAFVSMLIGFVPVAAIQSGAAAATGPGRDIGDAEHLTGSASGSLKTKLQDDWWVVYPSSPGASMTIKVEDTSTDSSSCDSLDLSFRATDGHPIVNVGLVPQSSYDTPFSDANSDRYFVELTTANCEPDPDPVTYSLTVKAGGGGAVPSPGKGSAKAGATIGDAWPPLQGETSYTGTIDSSVSEDWYVLYKHAGTNPATIRVENTTVKGSTDCPSLNASFLDTDGHTISNVGLLDNSATTFSTAASARYYLELTDGGCPDGGTTYRIEPEPGSQWDKPAKLPTDDLPVGPSRAKAGGPLKGGITYTGSIKNSQVQLWSEFDTNGKVPVVTISAQNTTNNQSTCPGITVSLLDKLGHPISNVGLGDNTGHEFLVDTKSHFYLEITDGGCTPGGPELPKVGITITPAKGVDDGGGDGKRVPAKQLHTSAAGQAFIKDYEKPKKSLLVPYNDSGGNCTVGWGHLLHKGGCTKKEFNTTYTQAQINSFWTNDLATHEQRLKTAIGTVPLLQQEFDALSSFVFNLGAICGSGFETICGDLRAKPPRYSKIARDLKLYDTDGHGHVVCGLYRRRLDEGQIWTSGNYTRNSPKCP